MKYLYHVYTQPLLDTLMLYRTISVLQEDGWEVYRLDQKHHAFDRYWVIHVRKPILTPEQQYFEQFRGDESGVYTPIDNLPPLKATS